jgi:hypothetical protein
MKREKEKVRGRKTSLLYFPQKKNYKRREEGERFKKNCIFILINIICHGFKYKRTQKRTFGQRRLKRLLKGHLFKIMSGEITPPNLIVIICSGISV